MYKDKEKQKEAWKRAKKKYYYKGMTINSGVVLKDMTIDKPGITRLPFAKPVSKTVVKHSSKYVDTIPNYDKLS